MQAHTHAHTHAHTNTPTHNYTADLSPCSGSDVGGGTHKSDVAEIKMGRHCPANASRLGGVGVHTQN